MRPLRIAVIGAGAQPGSRARQYLATIARLPGHYILAAVCDRNAEISREAAATYGARAHYSDVRELFAGERPDVVLSLAPKDSHIVIALTAARQGIHIPAKAGMTDGAGTMDEGPFQGMTGARPAAA